MSDREVDALVAEKWVSVPDFPEYQISDQGHVRRNGRLLKLHFNKKGYASVPLWRDGRCQRSTNLHRLMALAFISPPPTLEHQAAHDDGNSRHNIISNIKWKTPKENIADKERHGTKAMGVQIGWLKFPSGIMLVLFVALDTFGEFVKELRRYNDIQENRNHDH